MDFSVAYFLERLYLMDKELGGSAKQGNFILFKKILKIFFF